ncbi:anti-phage defense ZorAB system protein ZorA [Ramlibacter sp. XY19]|uniref:anti-phage ZorAB system protein ZorA n=1 Tax=Ramlibacter paludis TaxID=2908000 RepID=UPI0023DB43AE|nr:anti-phage ZorAB system protein ZorA [Ramlibacter paludis]MCG2593013.1 anti-phage defense ZorAB system protein ZorA [Ramlibacter paludis]
MAVFLVVALLTGLFIAGYLLQGLRVGWQLTSALRGIRSLKRRGDQVAPEDVGTVLRSEPLKHLWEEYDDTLHEVKRAGRGDNILVEVRATVPAEMFFTREVLVDSRLFDDFTRHLPGVLTGLGIIGTFAGLLEGLAKFDATSTASAVAGLKPLLDGVAHAFSASAIAIACAMFITFASRLVLALFYRRVEELNHVIDSLYETGAGEEYLSRLVHSSEKSEAHAAQLKQALVEDLTQLMTNLVERQISAQSDASRALGAHLGDTITANLAAPLRAMTEVMQRTGDSNSQAVSGMLENLLTGFMAKLEDTFGGQMRGIHEQIDRSASAMTTVQHALQKLVEDINKSNEQATNRLSGTLEDAMKQSAENQRVLTEQMREFVAEFRKLAADEQQKSQKAMDEAVGAVLNQLAQAVQQMEEVRKNAASQEQSRSEVLADHTQELVQGLAGKVETLMTSVGEVVEHTRKQAAETQQSLSKEMQQTVSDMRRAASEEQSKHQAAMDAAVSEVLGQLGASLEHLEELRKATAADEKGRNERLSARTEEVVTGLSQQVERLLKSVSEQVVNTQRHIDAIGAVSTRAIEGMNVGALNMTSAAQRFDTAGGKVVEVFDRSEKLSEQLTGASTALHSASTAVRQGFEQYESARRTVDANVAVLSSLVESVRKEAGLSKELVADLERIVQQLKVAETHNLQYLEGVSSTLRQAFEEFGTQLVGQIQKAIGETDKHLGGGVAQLNGVVQQIGVAMSRLKKAA